jgi:hypothetical protein
MKLTGRKNHLVKINLTFLQKYAGCENLYSIYQDGGAKPVDNAMDQAVISRHSAVEVREE